MKKHRSCNQQNTVAIVIPVHNEALGLSMLLERINRVTQNLPYAWSFVFINDGSTDESLNELKRLRHLDPRIGIINLSRCFGKEYAVSAGLSHVDSDAVILMDADLQDPPECLPAMLEAWQSGNDVVAMRRGDRHVDSWFKRSSARIFYAIMSRMGDIEIPAEVGDFRLMSRRVVDVFNHLPETNRCLKGLFAWIGFKTVILDYSREARAAGQSQWPILKLFRLAIDGITAFSIAPLRLATVVGCVVALLAILMGGFTVFKTLVYGEAVQGFPTLLTLITLLGGMQLIAIGVLGEYVGRTFLEVKRRPLFVVESVSMPTTRHTPPAMLSNNHGIKYRAKPDEAPVKQSRKIVLNYQGERP